MGFAVLGLLPGQPTALEKLGTSATFFLDPTVFFDSPADWRNALSCNHEIGNGLLLSATSDGTIRLWPPDAFRQELIGCDKLIQEIGQPETEFIFLPGYRHFHSEGSYLPVAHARYELSLSDSPNAVHWRGKPGKPELHFEVTDVPADPKSPTILILDADLMDLAAVEELSQVVQLVKLRDWSRDSSVNSAHPSA